MKLPSDCSGAKLIRVRRRDFGDAKVNQVGSHMILQTDTSRNHRLSVPDHPALCPGTFNAILRAVAEDRGIEKSDILDRL
jgi:predicted RNA binding protein YcfA (HicA-like mRNA interferase family)